MLQQVASGTKQQVMTSGSRARILNVGQVQTSDRFWIWYETSSRMLDFRGDQSNGERPGGDRREAEAEPLHHIDPEHRAVRVNRVSIPGPFTVPACSVVLVSWPGEVDVTEPGTVPH
jgi:hypothetical protein